MLAAGHPDAIPHRLLQHAGLGARSAPRILVVDPRSVVTRSLAYTANRYLHHHADHATHDATGGNGSLSAENDERDDAGHDGISQLELCLRLMSLMVGRKLDCHSATGNHEPYQPGARDARDGGQESQKEREMNRSSVSSQLQ